MKFLYQPIRTVDGHQPKACFNLLPMLRQGLLGLLILTLGIAIAAGIASAQSVIEPGRTFIHRVKSGEHLYRIIREQLKLEDEHKVADYAGLIKDLNPDRKNWDALKIGDQIRLPRIAVANAARQATAGYAPSGTTMAAPPIPTAALISRSSPVPAVAPVNRLSGQHGGRAGMRLAAAAADPAPNGNNGIPGLMVGERFSVRGNLSGERLIATRLQDRDPTTSANRGQVEGRIGALNAGTQSLRIGPFTVRWDGNTRFEHTTLAALKVGETVEVNGTLTGPLQLMATTIEKADEMPADGLKVLGTVTEDRTAADGVMELTILGMRVAVTRSVFNRASTLTRRPDDRRPEDQFTFDLFGRPATLGGEFESTWRYRGDYRLRRGARDDFSRLESQLQLELFYPFAANYSLFLESKVNYEGEFGRGSDERRPKWELARGETWLFANNLFGSNFNAQIGRQNIREDREWWWDDDLDAVRLHFDRRNFHGELAIAQELTGKSTRERRIDTDEKDVFRLLAHTAWSWARNQRLHGFFLFHNDHSKRHFVGQLVNEDRFDDSDARLIWLGGRSSGRVDLDKMGELDYSADLAWAFGRETIFDDDDAPGDRSLVTERMMRTVNGWGFDSSLSWAMPWWIKPTFTLGYAVGSGDRNPESGGDHSFRQTGLHANKGRFRGVNRFRYYGELLRPELSNLHVWTSALGFRFWRSNSVEFVYHYYRQVRAADFLRDAAIKADPLGQRLSIGHEWDLIIGMREWKHVDLELIGAMFRAGSAFGPLAGRNAFTTILQFTYNF